MCMYAVNYTRPIHSLRIIRASIILLKVNIFHIRRSTWKSLLPRMPCIYIYQLCIQLRYIAIDIALDNGRTVYLFIHLHTCRMVYMIYPAR